MSPRQRIRCHPYVIWTIGISLCSAVIRPIVLTTLHGRLDAPEVAAFVRAFPGTRRWSLSQTIKRTPVPHAHFVSTSVSRAAGKPVAAPTCKANLPCISRRMSRKGTRESNPSRTPDWSSVEDRREG